MRQSHFLALSPHGFYKVAYTQWGDPANPRVLLCVHGLTRNGRDFDHLARAMEGEYRVVCPDVIGRGKSDWLTVKSDYGYPLYCAHMAALIAHLGVDSVDWVGTSMGGLIGMMLAALPNTPIRRLVMNDIGPFVAKVGLERLAQYVGKDPEFASVDDLEQMMRVLAAPFGPLTDAQWRHMALHGHRIDGEGKVRFAYDPAIGDVFRVTPVADVDLWPVWQAVHCPVLVVHGETSDLLRPESVARMLERSGTSVHNVVGVGHAPMLMDPDQIAPIRSFLLGSL
jgi:pimeloyl-ACP methyl ester carboxylesterase